MEKLNVRARKIYLALGLIAGLGGGMESAARAQQAPEQVGIELKTVKKVEKPDGSGEVVFARSEAREVEIGGEKGMERASIIRVIEKSNDKEKLEVLGRLYKFQGKKNVSWDMEIKAQGNAEASTLGKFEPTKQKGGGNVNMAREIFNSKLLSLGELEKLIEGMKDAGEGKSEEIEELKKKLELAYFETVKRFPNQKLNEAELIRVLGRRPRQLKEESAKDTRTSDEKELDIPAQLSVKDMPKDNPLK